MAETGKGRTPAHRASAYEPSADPWLDQQIIEQLLTDAGSEGVRLALEIYLQEVKDKLADIAIALDKQEWARIGRHAHSLKSASGTFGLVRLQNHCAALQNAESLGEIDDLTSLAASLPEIADPSLGALRDYLARSDASRPNSAR